MNRLLSVYAADFQAVVQPGLLYKDMNRVLARHGLFFAPDPGANASLGGMIANNAAGTRTPKYGATRDNVLALEVVLADGQVIRSGSRSVKQSAGYDLTHLFVGSEGTLGLITEATIRLAPLPAHFSAATVAFPTLEAAAQAVSEMIGAGLGPAALEILDAASVGAMNGQEEFELPTMPALFLEFHGATEETLAAELSMAQAICGEHGARAFEAGIGREARSRLWAARHQLGEILPRVYAGLRYVGADVAVPISAFPALAAEATAALEGLPEAHPYLFGHAGDGNLHAMIFVEGDDSQYEEVRAAFNDRVVAAALRLGGTCTGEHGVGIGKRRYMVAEHGAEAVKVMWAIKRALDPLDLLNPGKVLPEEEGEE
jgi:D-lactate dehydrogenase (cytochrome)